MPSLVITAIVIKFAKGAHEWPRRNCVFRVIKEKMKLEPPSIRLQLLAKIASVGNALVFIRIQVISKLFSIETLNTTDATKKL